MVSKLILSISALQSTGDKYFAKGLFPSFRENKTFCYQRPDSNIFASASIAFILKEIKPLLSDVNDVDTILNGILQNYPLYRNKDGLDTYNFWPTKPSRHFPNGYIMQHFIHFKLPDDIDDTALIYLTNNCKLEQVNWLKAKLGKHTDGDNVYSTWFAENMPIEHDVCALCHLIYLVFDAKTSLNSFDLATLQFLNNVIVSFDFLNKTFWFSRHYATIPLIIYHYARLLGKFEIPALAQAKETLLTIIPKLFELERIWLNKVLLQTAYFKISGSFKEKSIMEWNGLNEPWEQNLNIQPFYSFIGAPFAPLRNTFLSNLASNKNLQLGWKSKAHELTLALENVVLRNNLSSANN